MYGKPVKDAGSEVEGFCEAPENPRKRQKHIILQSDSMWKLRAPKDKHTKLIRTQ